MGKVMLPFVDVIRAKGRTYHYYRRGKLRRRINGEPGTEEFDRAYQAIHQPAEAVQKGTSRPGVAAGSIRAMVIAYKASAEWQQLRASTHVDYRKALDPLEEKYGHLMVAAIPREFVFGLRDLYAVRERRLPDGTVDRRPTPRRGNRMVAVLSLLMT